MFSVLRPVICKPTHGVPAWCCSASYFLAGATITGGECEVCDILAIFVSAVLVQCWCAAADHGSRAQLLLSSHLLMHFASAPLPACRHNGSGGLWLRVIAGRRALCKGGGRGQEGA